MELVARLCMQPIVTYLDANDLAELLGLTTATVRRRLRARPWALPPPVYLGPGYPLRWRQVDVAHWLQEEGASVSENARAECGRSTTGSVRHACSRDVTGLR